MWQTRMYLCTWQQNMTTIMQPLHCDLQPEIQQVNRTTRACRTPRRNTEKHTVSCSGFLHNTSPRQHSCSHYNAICIPALQNTKGELIDFEKIQTATAHTQGTLHPRLQPFYTEKRTVSCSGFVTTSLGHHFPSSPLPFVTTSLTHHVPSSPLPLGHHFPGSPLPFVTTSLRHHFPYSPLP